MDKKKLTKPQIKRLCRNAQKIEGVLRDDMGQTEKEMTYQEMLDELAMTRIWSGEQYGNTILISGTLCGFTVTL